MASTSLTALSLTPNPSFNWFFLLELIVSCILVLFFLLYFNRLFATLLSYGIRAYTWHYYRAYVDIRALQISPLGGRIFFKGIRYHGVNETIFVHGGFITWHYWKRTVRRTDVAGLKSDDRAAERAHESGVAGDADSKTGDRGEQGGLKHADSLPCRITAKVYGLEWFIYNRTPAYEGILAGFNPSDPSSSATKPQYPESDTLDPSLKNGESGVPVAGSARGEGQGRPNTTESQGMTGPEQELGDGISRFLRLLPMRLECDKGAIVMGNENTRSVLTTTFDSATGLIEACNAGPLDLYRQVFSFSFSHPVIQMRPNPDFKQNQLTAAKSLGTTHEDQDGTKRKRGALFNYKLQKRRVWHSIRDLIPYFQKSVESFHVNEKHADSGPRNSIDLSSDTRWVGLSRYLDESAQDDHEEWSPVEYGRYSTILDSPEMSVAYYWDIPGNVKVIPPSENSSPPDATWRINSAPPPEWGIDIKVNGGTINYGPWADRERVGLQNVFFPNAFRNSEPSEPLNPGQPRQTSAFTLRVEISDELTLRIPTREPSKDWQWKGRADTIRGVSKLKKQNSRRQSHVAEGDKGHIGPDRRPFGWLSLRVAGDSTIRYNMDMLASASGFQSQLDLDLRDTKLLSSVNHALLWQCPRQLITCDLSVPLSWNSMRTWKFDVESHDLELFLLRDHIFLLTDLVSDWASGPPPEYSTFVPFIYKLNLSFSNLQLFLNVNDMNIVNNPSDLDDNRTLAIKGKRLSSDVTIPLNKYRPEENAISFIVNLQDAGIDYLTPVWDTMHAFLSNNSIATLEKLTIDGVYNYYLTTSSDLVDTLVLNVDGFSPKLYLFGFLIRSFMTIKENYFGEEMHFKTLEEYQELAYPQEDAKTQTGINPTSKSNDLDVIVHVTVDNPYALLPENIYDNSNCIKLTAASLEADLRFTNYYMDLYFSIAPLKAALESSRSGYPPAISETQLFIDGVCVYGHRLFGLPPLEPTYVCNWDFDIGRIIGECSTDFLSCLTGGLKSFDFSFDNEENALPLLNPLQLHDVTFLRARIDSVHVSVLLEKAALILSTGIVTTRFNDWANTKFSKRMSLLVPDLSVAAIDYKTLGRSGSLFHQTVTPLALLESTLSLRMVQQKGDFNESRKLQQEHVKLHDRRTQRTPWLIFDWEDIEPQPLQVGGEDLSPPTIAIPTMPEPVARYGSVSGSSPSMRRFSATGSNRSFGSFFVTSEVSSVKSGRKRRPYNADYMKFPLGDRKDLNSSQSTVRGRDISQQNEGRDCSEVASLDHNDVSSTWSMPAFSLYKVKMDTSQLPLGPASRDNSVQGDNEVKIEHPFSHESDGATHSNFAIELPLGIRSFCSPGFLHVVSALVEKLQPSHPSDIIDSLQKDIISDIVAYEKSMSSPRKCTGIAIRAPCMLVKLINPDPAVTDEFSFRDEYSIEVSHLKAEIKSRVERRKGDLLTGVKKSSTVHAATEGLSISVQGRRADAYQEKTELRCVLGDMNFWLVAGPMQRSNLQIRSFETVTSTKSVEHLASLVRRTTTMIDSIASSFKHSLSIGEKRLRFLVYSLTQQAANIPDPSFLIRISYVLRVARTHLRQHDSWKIISRLRNVYKHLSPDQTRELIAKCMHGDFELPPNAKELVLTSFDQWRAWDLAHVEKSYVMRSVWNSFEPQTAGTSASMLFSSTVKLFRISIDPGPRESDFVIQDLSTAISLNAPKDSLKLENHDQKDLIVVQSYCASVSLRLRWEILDLVEGVLKTMSTVTLESAPPASKQQGGPEKPIELQLVLGADLGSITLDGINVKLALAGKALRSSLVHKSQDSETAGTSSLLLSSSACYSELSSNSKLLMMWRLSDPHIYGSRVSDETNSELINEWMIAASCRKLRYDMKEEPLSLAHIADRLIEDEVRFIYELINSVEFPAREQGPVTPTKLVHNKFHVAVFLDDYRLSFCILPSLTYIISGEVARTSITPRPGSKVEIDFDLKKNLHTFLSNEGGRWHSLSVLEIPPINGRIIADLSPSRTEMEVDITIEVIHLEASAVRSLLGALTRPEVSHLMGDLKQNLDILQLHLDHVLAHKKTPPQRKDSSNDHIILYKARMTMAGTIIHATAPALDGNHYSADLDIKLGMVRLRLDNGLDVGHPMEYPEFHVDSSNLSLDLKRKDVSRSRSYCSFVVDAKLQGTSMKRNNGELRRVFHLSSTKFTVDLFPESAALLIDLAAHLQERIKTLDLSHEVKRFKKLRRRGHTETERKSLEVPRIQVDDADSADELFNAVYSLDFHNIQLGWNMMTMSSGLPDNKLADLVFSIKRVELSNKKTNAAKLRIEDMQLQMVPIHGNRHRRSLNSALLPEVVFNVAYASAGKEVRLAFQAAGKSLDLRATSEFILPASMIRDSIASAVRTIREANNILVSKPSGDSVKLRPIFGNKRFRSVLIDVDFAGATVSLQGRHTDDHQTMPTASLKGNQLPQATYGQYVHGDGVATATFKAPGVALKVLFEDNGREDPALNAELKIDASTNVLYPSLVPLIKQVTTTIKEVMGDHPRARRPSNAVMLQSQKLMSETPLANTAPGSILGRCKLNVGILICRQEFSLSCQPIARVAATTQFDSVYVTINTVQSDEQERFLALLVAFNSLQASVKHVYSNESTASFEVKSMVMSIMNSKHLGSSKGISVALRVSPMNVVLNAKQVQDLLLFREIWFPSNEDISPGPAFQSQSQDTQAYIVQRYQQVAATPAFPWNTTISIEKLEIQLDLGSTLGKAQFAIHDLWLSTKKTSDWEQILCVSFNTVGIESKGRMSGLVELQTFKVHTSINWPHDQQENRTPLIQASISFGKLDVKVSFDYQPFLIAHISRFAFLMYNVRPTADAPSERLFSILDGDQVQVYCTSMTASQALALFQAWKRLVQDKQAAYEASLQDIERYLRRKTSVFSEKTEASSKEISKPAKDEAEDTPISLHTGVVVSINAVTIGVFPRSFFDNHVFKLEARDAQARFDVSLDNGKIHSALGLTLGQLRVALSNIVRSGSMEAEEMLLVSEVGNRVTGSRGGTILKVPRLVARMETWQVPGSHQIEYIFQSTFEGKVDVGWNYSRISFIRDMWESHSRALASRLGKPLPPSAVRITGALNAEGGSGGGGGAKSESQEKITAVVNVPQSKYSYVALETPVIETPQLRDMGEATPPLEWIGLQRDKLPNITHQIIIVTLLEIAKEVEDAYAKILGSS
ncbi:putative fermentation associated protein (Csf1) [Aspergillus homomorphus CBS 101889]|uniref:Putative fermentation associated protein n=1 Tax=Aspergillus homomorphus (strain CBS 101889) TaxID=1450537 RepID=A0A395I210_ASPHC|nr:putative fermentation associated protein [Aspergillus homomorphus CBS 101889]RAL13775.1 putative fermentation associated protein [Aspergillus homomorphus CBS 101889]